MAPFFPSFRACLLLWASCLLCLSPAAAQSLPRPLLAVPSGEQPIRLVAAKVTAEVVGTLARSEIHLLFLNPNRRRLEGELQFPLRDGQEIEGFALESAQGAMMPAVPVEKARGQQVFEAITRRTVDPALLEQTQGNNFRLRIYPLEPQKPRLVRLVIVETLQPGKDGVVAYRPPLNFGATPPSDLQVLVDLHGVDARRVRLGKGMQGAYVGKRDDGAAILLDQRHLAGGNVPELRWPLPAAAGASTSRLDGEAYFSAELPLDLAAAPRPFPRQLAILWDASASGAGRDHAREFALLDAYFKRFPRDAAVRVTLQLVRDRAEAPVDYEVSRGDWQALRQALESVAYDGASNGTAWRLPAGIPPERSLALLFGDGLANWGEEKDDAAFPIPLYTVNAAAAANAQRLRRMAEASRGRYLDLGALSPEAAAGELCLRRGRLLSLAGRGAEQLESASLYPQAGRLYLAGKMTADQAEIEASFENPLGGTVQRRLSVKLGKGSEQSGLAARRWARARIDRLESAPALHRAEILRLGERFGLVSSRTSLLVLESLDDFLRYRVLPPEGPMRADYQARQGREAADTPGRRSSHLDDLARRFAEKAAWWERDFPKGEPPASKPESELARERMAAQLARDAGRRETFAPAPASARAAAPMAAAAAPGASRPEPAAGPAAASIQLQKWQPDAAYARRLREAAPAERYAVYLDERPSHAGSTAFFLDAADVFFEKGETDLAVRILSNLAEMDLESRHLLRILAYRLQQAELPALALPLLKRVRELAPEEPQSWRDLGLLEAEAGDYQAAIDALWETASRPWDRRFADIDLIALGELNALAARIPGLDLSRVDSRLRRNLPLDLRAVLAWDADNTDIDLWVIDPNGEKAYFAHPLTYQGGRVSRDFTAGYGPEEFALKTAKAGRYEVRAQFYGHRQQLISPYTTLMLKLTTGFGTAQQKDERVVLRLSGPTAQVLVGSFEVGGR